MCIYFLVILVLFSHAFYVLHCNERQKIQYLDNLMRLLSCVNFDKKYPVCSMSTRKKKFDDTSLISFYFFITIVDHIGGVMTSVLVSSVVDKGTGRFVHSTISSIVVSAIVVSATLYKDVSAMVLFMLFYVLFITILCINNHIEYKNK